MVMEGMHPVGRITELSAEGPVLLAPDTGFTASPIWLSIIALAVYGIPSGLAPVGCGAAGPCGPVAPGAPCGMAKLRTAAPPTPEFVTLAGVPGAPVVTVPTDTVAAAPFVPFAPLAPFVPLSASSAQFPPEPGTSMDGSITAFALSAM
jgi:hypothetical protein